MHISPSEQSSPSTPAIAKAVERAREIQEDVRLLTDDVVSLDGQKGIDANPDPGHVVVAGKNLLPYTHRESRTFLRPPGSHGSGQGYPTDPVYRAEEHADVNARFDPATKQVESLEVKGRIFSYDEHQGHGLLGLGDERTVLSQTTAGANGYKATETVELFADGSLNYSEHHS